MVVKSDSRIMTSEYCINQVRREVDSCIEIWTEVLEELYPVDIEYAYAKGSCVKQWDSPIDYVPIISDVDIHIKQVEDGKPYPNTAEGFDLALKLPESYENKFYERNPEPLHVPRPQLIRLNPRLSRPDFVLPWDRSWICPMLGKPHIQKPPDPEWLRSEDLKHLIALKEEMSTPLSAFDRSGLDIWTLIRRMVWKVSPTQSGFSVKSLIP